MRKSKAFIALLFGIILILTTCFSAYAEEVVENPVETVETVETVENSWAEDVYNTISNYEHGETLFDYTIDSTVNYGIDVEPYIDVLAKQLYMVITTDSLPFGHVIYDDPATDYIDGIRINDQTITSLKVPIDYKEDIDFKITIRTTYAEGFTGTIAQIEDGTFNWITLLENPIGLLLAMYYAFVTVNAVVKIVNNIRNKNVKVKTADDIANLVSKTALDSFTDIDAKIDTIINEKFFPILAATQDSVQNVVKAVAVGNSKSKDAPVALLEILQKVSNNDTNELITKTKAQIIEAQTKANIAKETTLNALDKIANTVQEVSSNEKQTNEDVAVF